MFLLFALKLKAVCGDPGLSDFFVNNHIVFRNVDNTGEPERRQREVRPPLRLSPRVRRVQAAWTRGVQERHRAPQGLLQPHPLLHTTRKRRKVWEQKFDRPHVHFAPQPPGANRRSCSVSRRREGPGSRPAGGEGSPFNAFPSSRPPAWRSLLVSSQGKWRRGIVMGAGALRRYKGLCFYWYHSLSVPSRPASESDRHLQGVGFPESPRRHHHASVFVVSVPRDFSLCLESGGAKWVTRGCTRTRTQLAASCIVPSLILPASTPDTSFTATTGERGVRLSRQGQR